jgi:hypothetical protein
MTILVSLAILVAVIAAQTAWTLRHERGRPFEVRHNDIVVTVDPKTNRWTADRALTPLEFCDLDEWIRADWTAIRKQRYGWRIVRPFHD